MTKSADRAPLDTKASKFFDEDAMKAAFPLLRQGAL